MNGSDEARYEEKGRQDREHDLAAPDVAPESKGQREDAEELAEELDDADNDHHAAHEHAFAESGEVEPAGEVADSVLPDARGLVPDEAGQRESEVGVVIGGRRVEQLDLADERDDRKPVAEQREQKERAEEREESDHSGPPASRMKSTRN